MAYGFHGKVHKGDSRATSKGVEVQKEHHLEEHPALKFHEGIVGHSVGEIAFEVELDEVKVIVLEVVECAKVEHD